MIDRRTFLSAAAGAVPVTAAAGCVAGARPGSRPPLFVATWPFGRFATETAAAAMRGGASLLDAVEQGIRDVESRGPDGSVGLAGRPNAAGYTQLDACIMYGPGHRAGSVAGLEGIVHPITAARRVMEHSKHVMLVGEGARWFALEHGLESVDVSGHAALKQAWRERQPQPPAPLTGHDTVTLLGLGPNGDVAGGCSTSGAGGKLPGRVGDSPILGAGLYVDNEVGAAGATGLGENIMRHCASYAVVERMRAGAPPQQACEAVLHDMARRDPKGYDLSASFIALDVNGRWGAASSNRGFPFAVTIGDTTERVRVPPVAR